MKVIQLECDGTILERPSECSIVCIKIRYLSYTTYLILSSRKDHSFFYFQSRSRIHPSIPKSIILQKINQWSSWSSCPADQKLLIGFTAVSFRDSSVPYLTSSLPFDRNSSPIELINTVIQIHATSHPHHLHSSSIHLDYFSSIPSIPNNPDSWHVSCIGLERGGPPWSIPLSVPRYTLGRNRLDDPLCDGNGSGPLNQKPSISIRSCSRLDRSRRSHYIFVSILLILLIHFHNLLKTLEQDASVQLQIALLIDPGLDFPPGLVAKCQSTRGVITMHILVWLLFLSPVLSLRLKSTIK